MTRNLTNRVRVWLVAGLFAASVVLSGSFATTAQAQNKD